MLWTAPPPALEEAVEAPAIQQEHADYSRTTLVYAKRLRDEFFSRTAVDPDSVKGLDERMVEAMWSKRMDNPPTTAELAESCRCRSNSLPLPKPGEMMRRPSHPRCRRLPV
jgi:hypothetical protein